MEGGEIINFPTAVKLPSIGSKSVPAIFKKDENKETAIKTWLETQPLGERIIVQEKIDGSNFTVFRPHPDDDMLHFFNKGKRLDEKLQQNSTYVRSCEILTNRPQLFRPGYIYHGESLRAARASHIKYRRIPKFHWICYEIMIPGGVDGYRSATPEEMTEILSDTGIEQAHIFYDSNRAIVAKQAGIERLVNVFDNIERLPSCLGNYAEGVVVKVLNHTKKNKVVTSRTKYVSAHMRERKGIEGAIAPDCTIEAIGDVFNVAARHRKAVQHLEERGEEVNRAAISAELDADLKKEHEPEICALLMQRYWPAICKAARKDALTNLEMMPVETKILK